MYYKNLKPGDKIIVNHTVSDGSTKPEEHHLIVVAVEPKFICVKDMPGVLFTEPLFSPQHKITRLVEETITEEEDSKKVFLAAKSYDTAGIVCGKCKSIVVFGSIRWEDDGFGRCYECGTFIDAHGVRKYDPVSHRPRILGKSALQMIAEKGEVAAKGLDLKSFTTRVSGGQRPYRFWDEKNKEIAPDTTEEKEKIIKNRW